MLNTLKNLRTIPIMGIFCLSLLGITNSALADPESNPDQSALETEISSEILQSVPLYIGFGSVFELIGQIQGLDLPFSTLITIDGFYATDPITAGPAIDLPIGVIQQLRLVTAGVMAKQPNSAGTLIDAGLLSTDENMHWGFDFVTRPASLQQHQQLPQQYKISYNQLALHTHGAIIPKKLWYLAATQFDYAWAEGQPNFTVNRHNDRNMLRINYLGRLVWEPNEKHRLRLLLSGSPSFHQNVLQDYRVTPLSQSQLEHQAHLFGLGWQAHLNQRTTTQVALTYQLRQQRRGPSSDCTSLTDNACRIPYDAQTEILAAENSISQTSNTHRVGMQADLNWRLTGDFGFRSLQTGINIDYTTLHQTEWIPGGGYLVNHDNQPFRITLQEEIDGTIQPASGMAEHLSAGVYLQTKWNLFPGFGIDPGLRVDADWLLSADEQLMRKFHFLPRINLYWQPTQTSITIRTGYNRLRLNPSLLYLQDQIYVPLATNTYEYDATTDDYSTFYRRHPAFDPRTKNLPNPEVDQLHVQYQQGIWKQLSITASALWHHQTWPGKNQSIDALHLQIAIQRKLKTSWFVWAAYGYNIQLNPDSNNANAVDNTSQGTYNPRSKYPNPRNSHQVALLAQQQLLWGVSWSFGLNWLRADFSSCENEFESSWDHTWPITRESKCSQNQHVRLDARLSWDLLPLTGYSISILLDLLTDFQQQAEILDILNPPADAEPKSVKWSHQLWTNLLLRWRY